MWVGNFIWNIGSHLFSVWCFLLSMNFIVLLIPNRQLRKELTEAKPHKQKKKPKHSDKASSDDVSCPQNTNEMRQVRYVFPLSKKSF